LKIGSAGSKPIFLVSEHIATRRSTVFKMGVYFFTIEMRPFFLMEITIELEYVLWLEEVDKGVTHVTLILRDN
jgi:hypothetical protein